MIEFPIKFYNSVVKTVHSEPYPDWKRIALFTSFVLVLAGLSVAASIHTKSNSVGNVAMLPATTPPLAVEAVNPIQTELCDLSIKATTRRGANGNIKTYLFPHDPGYWQVDATELFCTAEDAELSGYRSARGG